MTHWSLQIPWRVLSHLKSILWLCFIRMTNFFSYTSQLFGLSLSLHCLVSLLLQSSSALSLTDSPVNSKLRIVLELMGKRQSTSVLAPNSPVAFSLLCEECAYPVFKNMTVDVQACHEWSASLISTPGEKRSSILTSVFSLKQKKLWLGEK